MLQFVKKLKFNIFFKDMCLEKNPFCRPSVPLWGARRATAGKFSLNFAKFSENFPHVPLVGKARQGFFDRLNALWGTAGRGHLASAYRHCDGDVVYDHVQENGGPDGAAVVVAPA